MRVDLDCAGVDSGGGSPRPQGRLVTPYLVVREADLLGYGRRCTAGQGAPDSKPFRLGQGPLTAKYAKPPQRARRKQGWKARVKRPNFFAFLACLSCELRG